MASACPLGHGGSGGGEGAAAATPSSPPAASASSCPLGHGSSSGEASSCPLGHSSSSGEGLGAPAAAASAARDREEPPPLPPLAAGQSRGQGEPAAPQLSKERVESTIPSATGDVFLYPSESQFFGAARAKGHDVEAKEMEMVVAIHNAVNERTWQEILKFESLHASECPTPKLIRFLGRPGELSPKARLMGLLAGRTVPFDRHDWHVDRCGAQVRYVVDFYDGKASPDHPVSIHIDARPEISWGGAADRFKMWARGLNIF